MAENPVLLRVLIIEDDPDDVLPLLRELQRGGFRTEQIQVETLEALDRALDVPFDLIVCDYRLGSFEAPQVLARVRDRGIDTPFIVVSGAIGEDLAVEMMKAGAHDYLMKGQLARLVPAVRRELEEAEVRRARRRAEEEVKQSYGALRRSDEERRLLLSRLVRAQEEERARIAADVHDDSIQVMTAALMRLELLAARSEDVALVQEIGTIGEWVRGATQRLRHLIFDLRPRVLEEDGLAAALREYLTRAGGPAWNVEGRLDREPDPETRVILYRVATEALTNVRKHAQASHVEVVLEDRDGGCEVRIVDDGVGFDAASNGASPAGHMGLSSMRERAELSGGRFELTSTPGAGTVVACWLPSGSPDRLGE